MPNTPHSSRGPSRRSITTGRRIAVQAACSARTPVHSALLFPRAAAETQGASDGRTTRLRLRISFKGNAALSAGSATKTLVVKK
jgi:hypothetical protein